MIKLTETHFRSAAADLIRAVCATFFISFVVIVFINLLLIINVLKWLHLMSYQFLQYAHTAIYRVHFHTVTCSNMTYTKVMLHDIYSYSFSCGLHNNVHIKT